MLVREGWSRSWWSRCGWLGVVALLLVVDAGIILAEDDSALVEQGRKIYMEGLGSSGITAVLAGDIEVPAGILTCGSCHGQHGEGRPEGGVSPTDLRPSMLRRPYEVTTPSGRRHGPYDQRALVKAIALGLDPAGNALQPAMPRYRMSRDDMDALLAFLEQLDKVAEAGVSETALRIGVPMMASSRDGAETAASDVVAAVLDDLSASGGLFGRQPRAIEVPIDPRASEEAIRRRLVEADIFALVSGTIGPGADAWIEAAVALDIPWIGPRALVTRTATRRPSLFFLEPGPADAGRALADHAIEHWPGRRVRLVRSTPDPLLDAVAKAFTDHLTRRGEPAPELLTRDSTAPSSLAGERPVLLLVPGVDGRRVLDILTGAPILALAPLAAGWLRAGDAPASTLHVALPFESRSQRGRENAARLWSELAARHGLDPAPSADAWHALTAVRVLTEGLRRVGGDPRRDDFVAALETLREFDTGVAPPITYGPNRRTGFGPPPVVQLAAAR